MNNKYKKENGELYKSTPAQRQATKNYYEKNKHNNKDLYKKRATAIVLKKFNAAEIKILINKMEVNKMNRINEMDDLIEFLGTDELLSALVQALSDDQAGAAFDYIRRVYGINLIEEEDE